MFTRTLWPDHSHIDRTSTRTFRFCKIKTTRTLTKLALAHSDVVKIRPLTHSSVIKIGPLAHWPNLHSIGHLGGPVIICEWTWNVQVLLGWMCEWSGLYNTEMCSASLANVRVVRFAQHRNVRVLVWSMCEWSSFYNTGMCECLFGQCASVSLVNVRVVRCFHHRNVRVNMQCASASLVCES